MVKITYIKDCVLLSLHCFICWMPAVLWVLIRSLIHGLWVLQYLCEPFIDTVMGAAAVPLMMPWWREVLRCWSLFRWNKQLGILSHSVDSTLVRGPSGTRQALYTWASKLLSLRDTLLPSHGDLAHPRGAGCVILKGCPPVGYCLQPESTTSPQPSTGPDSAATCGTCPGPSCLGLLRWEHWLQRAWWWRCHFISQVFTQ